MASITKQFFSGDIARGAEQGVVELVGKLNLGASYATNGIALDFANVHPDCDNANIIYFNGTPSADASNYALWDATAEKAVVYVRSTDAELANATDISAAAKHLPVRILFRVSTAVSESITL